MSSETIMRSTNMMKTSNKLVNKPQVKELLVKSDNSLKNYIALINEWLSQQRCAVGMR